MMKEMAEQVGVFEKKDQKYKKAEQTKGDDVSERERGREREKRIVWYFLVKDLDVAIEEVREKRHQIIGEEEKKRETG